MPKRFDRYCPYCWTKLRKDGGCPFDPDCGYDVNPDTPSKNRLEKLEHELPYIRQMRDNWVAELAKTEAEIAALEGMRPKKARK